MAARSAWVLNLDADLELAALASGATSYAPTKRVREAMKTHARSLVASLLGSTDVVVDESSAAGSAAGLVGRAFSPTPCALRVLRRAGADPEPHPSAAVLCRVSSRAFSSSLGTTLPREAFVTDLAEALRLLGEPAAPFRAWRVKRAFGMSGRGQRVVIPGAPTEADIAFVRSGLAQGGVQIEPDVVIASEYAIHGKLTDAGALRLGAVVRQRCDARGAWTATEPLTTHTSEAEAIQESLRAEALRVGPALFEAGYFGPFGIDAFTYRDPCGSSTLLRARSEVNARYTMGFATGFGGC